MKKIFLWGDYGILFAGVKYLKQSEDFIMLTLKHSKNPRGQTEVTLESIKYIPNTDYIGGYRSMFKYFKQEKPDFLAVVSGHQSIDSIAEFNKTKFFCEENEAEMIVVNPIMMDNVRTVMPSNIYEQVRLILNKELV